MEILANGKGCNINMLSRYILKLPFITLFLFSTYALGMEPTHKKRRTSHSPEEAKIRQLAETHDIPTLQALIHPLRNTEHALEDQIRETERFFEDHFPPEIRAVHPLITLPTSTLVSIRKQLNIYEQAVKLKKPMVEYEAWRNKVKGKHKHIGYFANRQMTGKDPAAHSYLRTFKGMAHTLPEEIAHLTEKLELAKGNLFLAQVTDDHKGIEALEAEIELIQDCIDKCKMNARIVLDSLEIKNEPNELLVEKFKKLLED